MRRFLQLAPLRGIVLAGLFCLAALPASATTYTVKAAGGGNYTTISACAAVVTAGSTCEIFAGTYSETPSITGGAYSTVFAGFNGSCVLSMTTGGLNTQHVGCT
jgi:hypothetical protein